MKYPEVNLSRIAAIPITNGLGEPAADGEEDWPRYIRTTDIAGLFSLDPSKRVTLPPEVAAQAPVEAGDILMTAAGSLGTSYLADGREPSCYAGYLVRLRCDTSRVNCRYAAYWTQSTHHLDQIATGAVKSTIDNFSAGKFRQMRMPLPPLEEQGRIADFLDDQVSRIDAAITARAAHARCGKELCDVMQEELLGSWGLDDMWSKSTVGRACQVSFGEAFASEDFTAEGEFPVIRMGDIGREGFQNFISKSLVPPGVVVRDDDVVVGMSGRFQVEVWTRGPAALNQRVAGLRWPYSGIILAAQVQGHLERFEQELGGTTLANLSTGDLRGIPVLVPSSETVLRDAVGRLNTLAETRSALIEISGKAAIALEEFKRSLVTAAVTGELDVTAARRGLPA